VKSASPACATHASNKANETAANVVFNVMLSAFLRKKK